MDQQTKEKFAARARIMKAMAHPTRLFILDQLARNEKCVRELTDLIGDDTSTVSKHLSLLKNAGLVDARKKGTQVWYSIKTPCVLDFFGCVETVLRDNAAAGLRVVS